MSEENLIEDLVENSILEDEIILNFDEKYNRITKDYTKKYSKEEKTSFIEFDNANKNNYSITYSSQLLEGKYPDYNRLIPSNNNNSFNNNCYNNVQ